MIKLTSTFKRIVGTVYLSPRNYERNSSEDLIGELEEEMFLFSQKGDIIVPFDYNARRGDIQETVLDPVYMEWGTLV